MNITVLTPHFAPDVAPTGEVVTRIVHELAERGHAAHVITSLPWYKTHRVDPQFRGKLMRHDDQPWGRITRLHPFPAPEKTALARRAAGFAGFSALAAGAGLVGRPADAVLAVSPPLTLAAAGRAIAGRFSAPFVFNVQDVYPGVAVALGAVANNGVIRAAQRLERWSYDHADAVTVLSDDIKEQLAQNMQDPTKLRVIPNFVDTRRLRPSERENSYRRDFGLTGKIVIMYAGNVGLSQSVDLVPRLAAALQHDEDLVFVVNGGGAAADAVKKAARGLDNVVFVESQPPERLDEVLAAADLHLVLLKPGLARFSVPSKVYSILAAGRPLVASVDPGSEVARVVEDSGAGSVVPPGDAEALVKEVQALVGGRDELDRRGAAGRRWVERWASPASVAQSYEELFTELATRRAGRHRS